jgi:restriction system protein
LEGNPPAINNEILSQYPSFISFISGGTAIQKIVQPSKDLTELTPEERIEQAAADLEQVLRSELIDRIMGAPPAFFEGLIVDLLVAMGYGGSHADAAKRIGKSGDGGVDGVISEDRLGLDRIYIQAKRYASGNGIGRPELQSFVGSLVGLGATKGVFVSTSTFTQHARDYAKHLTQRVVLIDGTELSSLMVEHNVGVRTAREVSLKRVDEDYFDGDD